ncbi:Mitochodrial transcription termination factor [Parasponia andersonii]|uniref:Mitochodrial transcription termination factor n=1 Tax=Parasponia andersonii TaxID=3476 RepID=A0A2P5DVQ0_PARAD|nr:Mitochodrial transcription termination factor [Parasponia andersonii]
MFMIHPRTLLLKPQRIMEILPEIVKLGFNPNTVHFALAFRSMALISKTLWEQKMEAYRSFGLSEDRVYSAFKIQPMCMLISEKKIKKLMTFFINKLNIETSVICKNPSILMLSLEKRIIPRALKTRGNTPKYALILHSPFIGQASARNKGRMASYLATRIQLHLERSYVNKLGSAGCLGFYNKAVAPRKTNDVMNARKLYKKGLAQLKIVP